MPNKEEFGFTIEGEDRLEILNMIMGFVIDSMEEGRVKNIGLLIQEGQKLMNTVHKIVEFSERFSLNGEENAETDAKVEAMLKQIKALNLQLYAFCAVNGIEL